MSGGHGHDDHGHGKKSKSGGGGIMSGFGTAGAAGSQITGVVSGLFLGLFGSSGGGGGHDHHH